MGSSPKSRASSQFVRGSTLFHESRCTSNNGKRNTAGVGRSVSSASYGKWRNPVLSLSAPLVCKVHPGGFWWFLVDFVAFSSQAIIVFSPYYPASLTGLRSRETPPLKSRRACLACEMQCITKKQETDINVGVYIIDDGKNFSFSDLFALSKHPKKLSVPYMRCIPIFLVRPTDDFFNFIFRRDK